MNVSTSNILKSAMGAARHSGRQRDVNLPIGETLRDLYLDDETPKTDGTFSSLLDSLDVAEENSKNRQ